MRFKSLLLTAVILSLSGARAQAQTIVHDPTSYAKLIEQAKTALDHLKSLQTQVQQGATLLDSLNQGTGAGALAQVLGSPEVRASLPDLDAFVAAARGDLSGLGALGAATQALRDEHRLLPAQAADLADPDLEATGVRAARDLALAQSVSKAAAARGEGLEALVGALDGATTARAVLDLQTRLAGEQALLANDQIRLNSLAMAQDAEARLQVQRERERATAARAARMAFYRRGFK